MRKTIFSTVFYLVISFSLCAGDTLKVHFLYGSKPNKKFKYVEKKWFGGIHGGHVGVEFNSGTIIDFIPYEGFHYVEKNKNRKSRFVTHNFNDFYSIFGGRPDSVKSVIFYIPIKNEDAALLDSISKLYLAATPYDYAFIGMRCAAAAYDLTSHVGITKKLPRKRMYFKIFYPKKLRKKLFKLAKKNGWKYETKKGSIRRIWESD